MKAVTRSEAGAYLRLMEFVYHSTLGLGVIKKLPDPALVDVGDLDDG